MVPRAGKLILALYMLYILQGKLPFAYISTFYHTFFTHHDHIYCDFFCELANFNWYQRHQISEKKTHEFLKFSGRCAKMNQRKIFKK